jgi:uncharacterized protein DUF2642
MSTLVSELSGLVGDNVAVFLNHTGLPTVEGKLVEASDDHINITVSAGHSYYVPIHAIVAIRT